MKTSNRDTYHTQFDELQYRDVLQDSFARHYAEDSDEWTRETAMRSIAPVVQGTLKINKTATVLDIGCGSGHDTEYFGKLGASATGLDLIAHKDWETIQAANPKTSFICSTLQEFSTPEKFDVVLDNGCFHHQHPNTYISYLKKAASFMHSESYLVLSTFKDASHQGYIDGNGRVHRYFSDIEVDTLLNSAGFSVDHQVDVYRLSKGNYYRLSFATLK